MKPFILLLLVLTAPVLLFAQEIASPDKQIKVSVLLTGGTPVYSVIYKGQKVIEPSAQNLPTT